MLEIGFNSGCLSVISNDFQSNIQTLLENIKPYAIREWNRFDDWSSSRWEREENKEKFEVYYQINKSEKQAFGSKSCMPNSFVKKYYKTQLKTQHLDFLRKFSNVLYHKKNPDTSSQLMDGLIKHKIYEVQCNICGKTYFMDKNSIYCVKWRSCSGAKCLSHSVSNEKNKYENLCVVNNESAILQQSKFQLDDIENISNPLSYYGGNPDLHISYISDLHLLHHLKKNISLKSLINNTVKRLYETMDPNGIIVFAGDISSDVNVTMHFYKDFVKYNDYIVYKKRKKTLLENQKKINNIESKKQNLEHKINVLSKYIDATKEKNKSIYGL